MNNPIRRVWVPKKVNAPAQVDPADANAEAAPAAPPVPVPVPVPPKTHNMLFDDLPTPEVEEKNSDSIWAEFDSVPRLPEPRK